MSRSKQTFEVNSWTDVGVDAIQTPELNSDQRAKFVVIGAGYSRGGSGTSLGDTSSRLGNCFA